MTKKYDITGVILAGGTSSRMGFNKELITIDNELLTTKLIGTFHSLFNEVIVVSKNKELYNKEETIIIEDILESNGPLIGLHAALKHAKNDFTYIIACDMPIIDESYIHDTVSLLKDKDAYVVKDGEYYEPFHGFYHKRLFSLIEQFVASSTSFTAFIKTINIHSIKDISAYHKDLFLNINTPSDLYHLEHQNDAYSDFKITKYSDQKSKHINDYVIDEYPLVLYLNNVKYVTLLATPKNTKELIVGYLRSEKIIDKYENIKKLDLHIDENKAYVEVDKEIDFDTLGKDKLLVSGCGVGTKFHEALDDIIMESIDSDYFITKEEIVECGITFNNQSGLFRLTGGVHSCLFKSEDETIYFEDIGRHNAVDKVVGHVTINNIKTTNSYVFSSGRISSDMLLKCAIAKIPIVISRSAPTSLAVTLALKYGITLIGFSRGTKFNVYSHSYRIK